MVCKEVRSGIDEPPAGSFEVKDLSDLVQRVSRLEQVRDAAVAPPSPVWRDSSGGRRRWEA